MLSQSRMIPGQTPLDYYQQVEMAVFQGVRDYPHEIGDAEGLIRRTFKAGLPERLQRQLSLHTFSSARAMAEGTVSRHCGGQASQPVASPPSSSTFTYPPTTRPLPAESVPGLDFYSDNPFSVQATQATQTGSPGHSHNFDNERGQPGSPRQRQFQAVRPKKWCTYHRATTPLPAGRGNFSCEPTSRVSQRETNNPAPVHVVQTEFIEPKSGQFVSAAVARGLPESRAILVEGTNPKFIVPRSISAVQGRRTSVWVVNPDAKQRKLTQGTCIGFAEQVGAEQLVDVSAEGNVTGKEPRVKEDTVTHPSSTGHAGRDFSPEAAEFSQPKFTDATTQVHSLAEIDADELAPRSCKVWPADEQVAECPSDTSDDDIELYTPALSGSDACSDDSVLSPNKSGINVVESSDSPSKQVDLGHLDSVQQEELDEALAVNENHSVNSDTPVNLATLASAVLREYQLKEDLWKEIIEFLEGKKLPRRALPASLHEFELDDGVLYHLKSLPDRIIRQVCVPHSLQSQALHLAHDHPTAAHPGALRTYHNLQNSYFFPNMFRLCKWYVQHCTACQHRKGSRERAEMQCRPPPSGPLELVSADLMDLRASVGGYRYVLSIVDHHSRYLQLVPLRNKTAETVLRGFYDHFITLFGPPRQIMTDNGGEFANEQWQEVCRQLEIRCSFTIAYHPSSNGLVERTNRVVKDALAMLVADKPGRWPLYLTSVRGLTNQVTTDTNLRVQQLAKARQLAIAASLRSREANAQAHNRKVRSTWQPEEGSTGLPEGRYRTDGKVPVE
ncbi:hypothetical protein C7M84_020944 [Penaeus vannamei]|uniref:RNA-directed DNA polymerase n=1 Tax=Penaeus vannamei TaxID=6689 RepID=A0A423SAN3_PENVA|nr:hypothetical protein C7M84_020944 [Penaeus vannamei]